MEIREYFFFSLTSKGGKFCKVFPRVYTVNRYVIHFYTINKIRTLYPRVAFCIEIVSFVFHVDKRENKRNVVTLWNIKALSVVGILTCMFDEISPCSRNQVNEGKERKKEGSLRESWAERGREVKALLVAFHSWSYADFNVWFPSFKDVKFHFSLIFNIL